MQKWPVVSTPHKSSMPGHLLFSLLQKSTNYTTTAWTIHMLFKFMKPLPGLPGTMQINTLMTLWQVNYKKHFLQIPSWKWKLCRSAFRRCSSNLRFKTTTEQTDMDFQQTCCDSSGTLNLIHLCASVCVCVKRVQNIDMLWGTQWSRGMPPQTPSPDAPGCNWLSDIRPSKEGCGISFRTSSSKSCDMRLLLASGTH